jgi:hypothetical protein
MWKVWSETQWIQDCKSKIQVEQYFYVKIMILLPNYLLNNLLTHPMEQSPSWEANRFAASQEIPHIL